MIDKQTDVPNHIKEMLKMIGGGNLVPKPGTVSIVNVLHDEWCDALNGAGPCNCDPDIVFPS